MDEGERETKRELLAGFKARAESAYDSMYSADSFREASVRYSDAKEFFIEAIRLAEELESSDEVDSLGKRLAHAKAVYRSQFTS